jgi:hypothetical protein
MGNSLPFALTTAIVMAANIGAAGSPAARPQESALRVAIYVYNVALVPSRVLRGAERCVATILGQAGIRTTWFEPRTFAPEELGPSSPGDPWVPPNITVRIYNRPMINEARVEQGILGFVWRFETNSAVVLYDRVQNLAGYRRIDLAPLLGIAMAHEIGHLLLGSREHSSEGIMRQNWPSTDLHAREQARLRFTADQSQRIRGEVLRRNHPPGGSPQR